MLTYLLSMLYVIFNFNYTMSEGKKPKLLVSDQVKEKKNVFMWTAISKKKELN